MRSTKPRYAGLASGWQALGFALAASALSLAAYWYHPPILEAFDQRGRDVVFRMREPPAAPPEIATIVIDERSIRQYGRWPWPRSTQARIIRTLKEAGAATIALDIVYAHAEIEECPCPLPADELVEALAAPGAPVVGGFFFRNERSDAPDPASIQLLEESRFRVKLISPGGHLDQIPEFAHVETNRPEIAQQLGGLGAFNRHTESDGLVRTAPLVLGYRGEHYPALALKALSVFTGAAYGLNADPEGLTALTLGGQTIPVDVHGRMALNFYGTDGSMPMYSATDLLAGELDPALLRDRLVFVGVTEVGIGDLLPTPVDPLFPGVLVHATVAGNILQGHHLYRNFDTVLLDVIMMALIPLVMVLVMARLRRLWHMGAAFFVFGLILVATFYWLVARQHHLVSLVYPLAAVALAFISFQIYYILTAQRTTKFLTGAFSSYVAPALVDQLLRQPDRLGLSGEKREITVLFSDIRNFTTISEQLEPEQLVDLLNRFLGRMTEIILARSGTLDKYIGDAIMALFNAPLNIDGHARKAADAALEMRAESRRLAPEIEQAYGIEVTLGIGLHSGPAIVGNLGSENRFDYTAIGDTVNLASRAETITRQYGVDIIITESVASQLGKTYCTRKLDRIRVKGKQRPVVLHELMSDSPKHRRLAKTHQQALDLYFSGSFESARHAFEQIVADCPEDRPAALFADRCRDFEHSPPGDDWDGVYVATEK